MSQVEKQSTEDEDFRIPVLLVPNARDILTEFNTSIQRINAHASTESEETTQEKKDYGFKVNEKYSISTTLNYERERNTDGEVVNPLTENTVRNINSDVHQYLSSTKEHTQNNITYDLTVTRLIVEVESDLLNWKYEEANSDFFFFDFQLESAKAFTGDFKDMIKPHFEERNLTQQGFNWRVPVLRQIIPLEGYDVEGDSHDAVFSWNPSNPNTSPMYTGQSQKIAGMLPQDITHNKEVLKADEEYWMI